MSTAIVGKSPSIVSVSENGWYYIMVLRFEQQQLPTNEQHIHKQKQILAPNVGKRVVNPLELVTCKDQILYR